LETVGTKVREKKENVGCVGESGGARTVRPWKQGSGNLGSGKQDKPGEGKERSGGVYFEIQVSQNAGALSLINAWSHPPGKERKWGTSKKLGPH